MELRMPSVQCYPPYVREEGLAADAVKQEDVYVCPVSSGLTAEDLFALIKKRTSTTGDPARFPPALRRLLQCHQLPVMLS
jgi:hypothetical protein